MASEQTTSLTLIPRSQQMPPSQELKQAFRTLGMWSTVLVVMIHYRSALVSGGHVNGWLQEILTNGIGRVAVPLFAFTAGFFYFLTFDGTRSNYLKKLRQRVGTLLVPYLLVSLLAFTSWLGVQLLTNKPMPLGVGEIATRLLLRPMPEQLWFLRDLMLLVILAPSIQWTLQKSTGVTLLTLSGLWVVDCQPSPIIAGWYALNIETLFGFTLGCFAVGHVGSLERLIRISRSKSAALLIVWCGLLAARVFYDPTFDNWYVRDFHPGSLLLQKSAIAVGCVTTFGLAQRLCWDKTERWAACSFFVYLMHEFPLREVLQRIAVNLVDEELIFWIAAPAAIVCCLVMAEIAARLAPSLTTILTGGRNAHRVGLPTTIQTATMRYRGRGRLTPQSRSPSASS